MPLCIENKTKSECSIDPPWSTINPATKPREALRMYGLQCTLKI